MKTVPNSANVDEFIAAIEDPQQRADSLALLELIAGVTGKQPKMWGPSIVGFGSYHYKYASGREGDFFLAGFSPRARNLTVYVMPGFEEYDALLDDLGKHKTGKSCLYINKLEDIDTDVLRNLVERSVAHMQDNYETA